MKTTINQLITKLEEAREKIGGDKPVKLWICDSSADIYMDDFEFHNSTMDEIERNLGEDFVSFQIEEK